MPMNLQKCRIELIVNIIWVWGMLSLLLAKVLTSDDGDICPRGVTSWPQQRSVSIRHPERNHWSLISKCLLGSDSLMTRFMISASKWWMLKRKGRQWYMFVKKDLKLALTWIWTKSYFHEVGGQNQNSWSADSLSFSLMGQVLSILNPPKLLATCKSFY